MPKSSQARLAQAITGYVQITPSDFAHLATSLEIPESRLRRLLREYAIPIHPLVEGVRQDTSANLTRTLRQLAEHPNEARPLVLEAKQHARFAQRRHPDDPWRAEILLHLQTWLENPSIYPTWSKLRTKEKGCGDQPQPSSNFGGQAEN
jgi:hypothetical protein